MTSAAHPAAPAAPHLKGHENINPDGLGFWQLVREDLRTHDGHLLELGFWAIAAHRLGNARMSIRSKLIRAPFTIAYWTMYVAVECLTGITLPYTVRVGRRVRIWHHSGIVLHAWSIGDGTQIRQNTTFGIVSADRHADLPTIGARVDIGCGACILGAVHIGDDAKIGANAVVLQDVPAGATAVGIPARIIRRRSAEGEAS